jgi:hypothetical protein
MSTNIIRLLTAMDPSVYSEYIELNINVGKSRFTVIV